MNLDFNKTKNSVSDGNKTKTIKKTFGLEEVSESESEQVIGGGGPEIDSGE